LINKINKLYTWIISSELTVFVSLLIFSCLIIVSLDWFNKINVDDVQVEAHGFLMDIIVFGVLLSIFRKFRDKSDRIKRYKEEIEDFRDWKSDESKYRILGNVKRLSSLGVKNFDLNRCYLKGVILENLVFKDSDLNCVDLANADISNCSFENVDFRGAQFCKANIRRSSFTSCQINSANFYDVVLYEVDFNKSDLLDFNVSNNLHRARVLYKPMNMNESLYQQIKEKKPDLLEKPTSAKMSGFNV